MSKKDNMQLLSRAFSEAFESKYSIALSESSAIGVSRMRDCGMWHTNRKKRPIVIAAALVCAMLVTCSCAWSYHRERMGEYLIDYTPYSVRVRSASNVRADLSEYRPYQLGYVPDGYVLTYEVEGEGITDYIWENSEGEAICFRQTMYNELDDLNSKGDEIYLIDHNGTDILYIEVNDDFNAYIHRRGNSHVVITSHERFSDEVIGQMIDSITEK